MDGAVAATPDGAPAPSVEGQLAHLRQELQRLKDQEADPAYADNPFTRRGLEVVPKRIAELEQQLNGKEERRA
jgi:hypothetical protein